jgi:hypothetical protein
MARTYTVTELVTRLDDMCDIANDTHISLAEKIRYIDNAYTRLWTKLAKKQPPDYFVKDVAFNTVAGQLQYPLATIAPAGDFWQLKTVYVNEGNGQLRPIPPINEFNIQAYRAVQVAQPMQLSYISCAPKLTAGGDTVDGIQGWEELLLCYAAEAVMYKKKDPTRPYVEKARELEREIEAMGGRDVGWAETIVRKKNLDPYFLYRNNVDGYRLRGSNLELYFRTGYLAVP